jgi:hypothetical protein
VLTDPATGFLSRPAIGALPVRGIGWSHPKPSRRGGISPGRPLPRPSMTPERQRLEALFLSQLGWIERVVAAFPVARLARDDAGRLRLLDDSELIEDDYAVFRKFRGESALDDLSRRRHCDAIPGLTHPSVGRWRPSAAARRGGALCRSTRDPGLPRWTAAEPSRGIAGTAGHSGPNRIASSGPCSTSCRSGNPGARSR